MRRGRFFPRWRHVCEGLPLLREPLPEQRQLFTQGQDIPLLAGQRRIEACNRVFLESELGLQFLQGKLQGIIVWHGQVTSCAASGQRASYYTAATPETQAKMAKRDKNNSRLVYSTDAGRLCPQCHRPVSDCVCGKDRPAATGDGIVRLRRETKGRGGKAVTVVDGVPLAGEQLKALAKTLKQRCGVGGSVKDGQIEIQGDQRASIKAALEDQGFTVKLSGG